MKPGEVAATGLTPRQVERVHDALIESQRTATRYLLLAPVIGGNRTELGS